MSRYFNSFMDDYSEVLEHSWGTSPEAKAREKEYNHWYYQKHKDEIAEVRKRRSAATNKYEQAEKYRKDAERYKSMADQIYDNYTDPETLKELNIDNPYETYKKYSEMHYDSESKSRKLKYEGDRLKSLAEHEVTGLLYGIKNPTVRDLVEFYFDTTFAKAKKSASKAVKKYATKVVSNAEKAVNKAKKYATKTIKSAANEAKKYVVR